MILFDDLLAKNDLRSAVDALASGFRKEHGFPPIHQLGIVVPDVVEASVKMEEKGIGPFFIASGAPVLWRERGVEKKVSGRMGLAYYNGLEIELLEPLEGSDFYTRSLSADGRPVLQHLGFLVADVDARANDLERKGCGIYVRGVLKSGPMKTDFAYMEPVKPEGIILEFICWRFLGMRFSPPPPVIHALGRIEKWSGRRCIKM